MTTVVGIRFTRLGRIHYFDAINQNLKVGDEVTVETKGEYKNGIIVLSDDQIIFSSLKPSLIIPVPSTEKDALLD